MTNQDSILKTLLCWQMSIWQSYGFSITGFSSNHAWMKSWTIKKADEDHMKTIKNGEELMFLNCGVGELEIPSDCKEIKPVNPQGNQPWIFFGRTDAKAEGPILWSPDTKSQLIGKYSDAGKGLRSEENLATEDEIVGWHNWLNQDEFEQIVGDSKRQGSLVCGSPWGCNWTTTKEEIFQF